jgi:myo-inositol 2-dehydrogenase/D-chiro-inositol 1-dehydrogenase
MEKIGVGFVGAGWMGSTLMRRVKEHSDAEILGLYQRSKENGVGTLVEAGLPGRLFYDDYASMLRNPEIDAIFICSTNEAHGPQAIAAQLAGKHVFCEKPCATEFDDFCRQIELEEQNPGKVTFVDYLMNFDTLEDRIRQMAKEGMFGTITQIQVNYRHPINIAGDKVWKLSKSTMGDAIGMGIIHSLSVMLNILAAQGAKPIGVYATSSDVNVRGFEVPAVWNIQIEFDNGATGFCFGNVDTANGYDAYHNIHGTKGGLIFDSYLDHASKVRYWSEGVAERKWIYPLDRDRCKRAGIKEHQTGTCVDHFLGCIHRGEQSFLSFANSASVAEVGWGAQISAARKERVPLPLNYEDARYFFFSQG